MTPKQVAALRAWCDDLASFEEQLKIVGYVLYSEEGCFKRVYRFPRGRYVVKVASHWGGPEREHMEFQNRSWVHSGPKRRRKLVTLLAFGYDFQVQRWVKPCRRWWCKVPGIRDTEGHNHAHVGRRSLAFDWC